MAENKKYLDLTGLGVYDEKIKNYIDAGDAAVSSSAASDAASKADAALASAKSYADGKLTEAKSYTDTEVAKANAAAAAADAKGAQGIADAAAALSAAQAAQATADGAQAGVNTLNAKVGDVPEGKNLAGMIDEVIASAYNDTEVRGLIAANAEAIADETERAEGVEAELLEAVGTAQAAADAVQAEMDAFKAAAEIGDAAIDTLIEIQNYITDDGTAAAEMTAAIAANKAAVEAEAARAEKAEGDLKTAYEAADTLLDGRIAVLEAAIGDEGSVEDMIDAAVAAEAKLRDDADKALDAKISANATAASNAQAAADKAQGDITSLTSVVNGKVDQTVHDALDGRVSTAEGKIATLESNAHENHTNREQLDKVTAELMAKLEGYDYHTHTNKAILDGISQGNIDAWNAAEGNAKTYADGKFVWAENAITAAEIDTLFTA